jgi:hypothetical protein
MLIFCSAATQTPGSVFATEFPAIGDVLQRLLMRRRDCPPSGVVGFLGSEENLPQIVR